MGGTQQSKLTDVSLVENLSFLEEGDFAKLYKGYLSSGNTRMPVAIKVPKVPDHIRKEKSNNITNKFRQICISFSIRIIFINSKLEQKCFICIPDTFKVLISFSYSLVYVQSKY
jgi:hypothetical protein